MKRTLHFVNGMTAMAIGLVGLSLAATANFSLAAPLKLKKVPPQPKISAIKTEVQAPSFGLFTDSMKWPDDAGTVNEVSDDTTGIVVTPVLQPGFTQRVKWAHVWKWSDEPVLEENLLKSAATLAGSNLKSSAFVAKAASSVIPVDAVAQAGKYLTVYSYVTNGDGYAPTFFPLGIDYATVATFFVPIPDTSVVDTEQTDVPEAEAQQEDAPIPAPTPASRPRPVPAEPTPAPTPSRRQPDPTPAAAPAPVEAVIKVQKAADAPGGAAVKGVEQTVGKFAVFATAPTSINAVLVDVASDIAFTSAHEVRVYSTNGSNSVTLLGKATLEKYKTDGIKVVFTKPLALAANEQAMLLIVANTTAQNSNNVLQVSIGGVWKLEGYPMSFLSMSAQGNVLYYVGAPKPADEPAPATSTAPTTTTSTGPWTDVSGSNPQAEPIKGTIVVAANAPGGAVSKGVDMTVAKFVVSAPMSPDNQTLQLNGVFVTVDSNIAFTEDRLIKVFKGEQLLTIAKLGSKPVKGIGQSGPASSYIEFSTPVMIEGGTMQTLTFTTDTQDAVTNSTFQLKLLGVLRKMGASTFYDSSPVNGKMLFF